MRIGMSLSSTHEVEDHRLGARWMIERARAARDADLDFVSLGDGHANAKPYYQGVPMMGRLLAEWDPTRPAGCLFLLPLWHPVIVAEQVATLATMLSAPFILQTGAGGGAARFAAMGADLTTRGRALDESIRVIKGLLAGEVLDSEHHGLTGARMLPLPPQPVEWWIGAGAPAGLRRAAREGDAWYAVPSGHAVERSLDIYRSACAEHGRTPRAVRRRDVIVLRDADRARRLGTDLTSEGYRGLGPDDVACGGVEEVAAFLAADLSAGFDDLALRCMNVEQADALETIELLGEIRGLLA